MKKYLVIGNTIDHSLSPKLHNHWLQENKIEGKDDTKNINKNELKRIIKK